MNDTTAKTCIVKNVHGTHTLPMSNGKCAGCSKALNQTETEEARSSIRTDEGKLVIAKSAAGWHLLSGPEEAPLMIGDEGGTATTRRAALEEVDRRKAMDPAYWLHPTQKSW